MFYLVFADSLGNPKRLEINKPAFSLGRQADNDLRILGASISRRHAEIIHEPDGIFIVDKASKSGTWVNKEQVTRCRLKHGDHICLGTDWECSILFREAEEPLSPSPGMRAEEERLAGARAELQNLARFLEVNQALKISLSLEEVLRLIVDAAIEITEADRGALLLCGERGNLEFRVALGRDRNPLDFSSFAMSRSSLERAVREGRSVILYAAPGGDLPAGTESVQRLDLQKIVCIPLHSFKGGGTSVSTGMLRRDIVGVLYVDGRQASGALSAASIALLESLAFEAAKSLETVRLMQQEEEKLRMEKELLTAHEVQFALLITDRLEADFCELSAHSVPSRYVDGDFFDLFAIEDGRMVFLLGDVAGKGIPAALLASMAQGVLHTHMSAGTDISSTVHILNRFFVAKNSSWRFLTLFCGVLHPDGRLTFLNAGHNPPLILRRDGGVERLGAGSMVVGLFEDVPFEESEVRLHEGDLLIAYTDGLTEAASPSGEMYGEARVQETCRGTIHLDAHEIRDRIFASAAEFTRGLAQSDDITVIVLKMRSAPAIKQGSQQPLPS